MKKVIFPTIICIFISQWLIFLTRAFLQTLLLWENTNFELIIMRTALYSMFAMIGLSLISFFIYKNVAIKILSLLIVIYAFFIISIQNQS